MDVIKNDYGILAVHTTEELEVQGLITEQDVRQYPKYFTNNVVIIFADFGQAQVFAKDFLLYLPRVHEIFIVRITESQDADAAFARLLGVESSGEGELRQWLVFEEEGFKQEVLPLLERIGVIKA
ncbi:MAG: hypothetical protein ACM3KR_04755 [Deltaproteobacteria bacterium]